MFCRLAVVALLLIFSSCSSRVSRCESQVKSYRHGETPDTDEKQFPIGAYTENRESVRLFLDRAVIRLQQGDPDGSLLDFLSAIDAIDYYRTVLAQETAVQLLTNDEQSAYVAKRYEALFARVYAAFACYALHQNDNAFAFLKQALAFEDLRNEEEGKQEHSPLLSYLMALHLERQKDYSQAELFYRRAYEACPGKFIEGDLQRLSSRDASRKATLLFIVHRGVIPEKISVVAPASIVSAAALEVILAGMNIPPAISSLSGIAIPAFSDIEPLPHLQEISINNKKYAPEKIEDLYALAEEDLNTELPRIAVKAAARQLIRRAAVGALREKNPIAGDVADLFAFIANIATEADTRMWKTLPCEIYLLRLEMAPGTYYVGERSFSLQSGELRVHQLFYP